jgi:hypothetical protein
LRDAAAPVSGAFLTSYRWRLKTCSNRFEAALSFESATTAAANHPALQERVSYLDQVRSSRAIAAAGLIALYRRFAEHFHKTARIAAFF